jgi:hypothetical protein
VCVDPRNKAACNNVEVPVFRAASVLEPFPRVKSGVVVEFETLKRVIEHVIGSDMHAVAVCG